MKLLCSLLLYHLTYDSPPKYLQSNYVLVFLILVLYCLISSPLLLIVIAGAGGAAYFAAVKNETRKIAIAGTY